jgi:hypothetical protein
MIVVCYHQVRAAIQTWFGTQVEFTIQSKSPLISQPDGPISSHQVRILQRQCNRKPTANDIHTHELHCLPPMKKALDRGSEVLGRGAEAGMQALWNTPARLPGCALRAPLSREGGDKDPVTGEVIDLVHPTKCDVTSKTMAGMLGEVGAHHSTTPRPQVRQFRPRALLHVAKLRNGKKHVPQDDNCDQHALLTGQGGGLKQQVKLFKTRCTTGLCKTQRRKARLTHRSTTRTTFLQL